MKRWQLILGLVLVILGIFSLINNIFGIDLGRFIGPLLLVGLGLLLIFRQQLTSPDVEVRMPILGDVRKTGTWEARKHEIWWFVGTTKLDFSQALFPEGESEIKIYGFVNDVKLYFPKDVGWRIGSSAFMTDYKSKDRNEQRFLSMLDDQSANYDAAQKRVEIQIGSFVAEINLKEV
jgi:lia operon protein LiaF